jgi:hypothetical protein
MLECKSPVFEDKLMDLIVAGLATWQIVEIWHHSLLMAPLRAHTEMWNNWLGELLSCPFCLSVWVGLFCTAGVTFAAVYDLEYVILAFAVSRLANLGNDVFKPYCRTPKVGFDLSAVDFTPPIEGTHDGSS